VKAFSQSDTSILFSTSNISAEVYAITKLEKTNSCKFPGIPAGTSEMPGNSRRKFST